MTPKQREGYRAALEKLREGAVALGPAKIQPNRTDETSSGVADEDAQALSEMLQAINSRRNAERAALLGRIAKALGKIARAPETYGRCEECEEPIPAPRLRAVPHAPLCAACQTKRDPERGQARRKTTEFL